MHNHPKAFVQTYIKKNNTEEINNLHNYLRKNVKYNYSFAKGKFLVINIK